MYRIKTQILKIDYTITNTENEEQFLNVISFAQISSNDKEYIFCRYKKNIYILYDETIQLCTIQNENIANYYCKIIPYKINNGHIIFIMTYINLENKFNLKVYDVNIEYYSATLIKEKELNNIYMKYAISCDFMNSNKIINNDVLVCFLSKSNIDTNTNNLVSFSFEPENDYKEEILSELEKSYSNDIIKSTVSPNKKKNL